MNYPAASYGVPNGIYVNPPRAVKSNLYPPQEGLSSSGGFKWFDDKSHMIEASRRAHKAFQTIWCAKLEKNQLKIPCSKLQGIFLRKAFCRSAYSLASCPADFAEWARCCGPAVYILMQK